MKQAIVAASFGTTHSDAMEKNIAPVEADLRTAFALPVFRALTSEMVRAALARRGQPTDNVPDALARARQQGMRTVVVQSTHLICGEEYDKLFGFELGIDDYVVKPFSPKELMARVNAVLSRNSASERPVEKVMKFDGLEINIPARTVYVDGKKVDLTPKEYDLLFYLVENKNIALSRDKLLSDIWGYDFFGDDRTIDTHIKNLRNNLGKYRDYIVTLRGVGYKFEA